MASVFLGDLDDVIGPSQACVNPIFATDTSTPPSQRSAAPENEDKGRAQVTVEAAWMDVEEAGGAVKPDLIKATGPGSAASVSLNDCLACSGCVTSAETVLISQQSTDQFLRILRGGRGGQTQALVVALSPQSLASLGVAFGWAAPRLPRRLGSFFKALARRLVAPPNEPLPVHVYSTASAAPVALAEATAEFVARYRHCQPPPPGIALHPPPPSPSPPAWEAPPPSRALSATEDAPHPDLPLGVPAPPPRHQALPMLVSECPGWVCYAEKTTPQVLPLLSTAKSPQQCLGTLVKAVLAPASGLRPGQVCVVAVMPCYDKKLEASRRDFVHAEWGEVPEVDMVLTAGEVGELVREYGPGEEEGCLAWGGGEGGGRRGRPTGPTKGAT
ncbi:cytosolic fe-s cluster assembly factor narfl [Nannochloropsis gaditana]|uniref:Cytosolic fe-s cluster assembly factor narfl n=1 Tax=Nannochloropsis gaditana TaxID=72520 RepID=W7T1J1_9STRA|nr:cytosolic fe-s cluster assembly factor narfl [Nannochloropsis gaditana]